MIPNCYKYRKVCNPFCIQLRDAVDSVASEFEFNQKTVEEIKEEVKDALKK